MHPVYAYDKKFFSIMKRQTFISLRYFYKFIVLVELLEASHISHRLSQRRIPSKFRQTKTLPCCIYHCTISELANFSLPLTRVDLMKFNLPNYEVLIGDSILLNSLSVSFDYFSQNFLFNTSFSCRSCRGSHSWALTLNTSWNTSINSPGIFPFFSRFSPFTRSENKFSQCGAS